MRRDAGFTLLETMVGLAILGVAVLILMQGQDFVKQLARDRDEKVVVWSLKRELRTQILTRVKDVSKQAAGKPDPCASYAKPFFQTLEAAATGKTQPEYSLVPRPVSQSHDLPSWLAGSSFDGPYRRCRSRRSFDLKASSTNGLICVRLKGDKATDVGAWLEGRVAFAELRIGFADVFGNTDIPCETWHKLGRDRRLRLTSTIYAVEQVGAGIFKSYSDFYETAP